jgi:hypothetical protein
MTFENVQDIAEISMRLEEISKAARERMQKCSFEIMGALGGAEIDFMTPEERAERHSLSLLLPNFAEDRLAAKERIKARIADRIKLRQF